MTTEGGAALCHSR